MRYEGFFILRLNRHPSRNVRRVFLEKYKIFLRAKDFCLLFGLCKKFGSRKFHFQKCQTLFRIVFHLFIYLFTYLFICLFISSLKVSYPKINSLGFPFVLIEGVFSGFQLRKNKKTSDFIQYLSQKVSFPKIYQSGFFLFFEIEF